MIFTLPACSCGYGASCAEHNLAADTTVAGAHGDVD